MTHYSSVLLLPLSTLLFLFATLPASSQSEVTTREEQQRLLHHNPEVFASVYRAYPGPRTNEYTPAPRGFKPVFLSHYGRHGSRYLIDDDKYRWLIAQLEGKPLTEMGQELLRRIRLCWEQAEGRGGDLTALGEQQHREIAERMMENYPMLFKNGQRLSVFSSTTPRCILSMTAFCERLKEENPSLLLTRDVCEKNMPTITCIREELRQLLKTENVARESYLTYKEQLHQPDQFVQRIFAEPDSCKDAFNLMEQLFQLAQDMQDCGRPTELLSFFTSDELYRIWCIKNLQMYLGNGDSPLNQGLVRESATPLLKWIAEDADRALQEHRGGATLRFGHDTSLLRLLTRMGVRECCPHEYRAERVCEVWQDFNNVPMGANLQIIFYQNKEEKTLVKFLLNENEVHLDFVSRYGIYYDWEDVKSQLKL